MGDRIVNWLLKKLSKLFEERFFGTVELTFKNGVIVGLKTVTCELPPVDKAGG